MLGCKRVVLVALVALVLTAFPGAIQAAADEKECEGASCVLLLYCCSVIAVGRGPQLETD